jgi:hypothetical protein
VRPGPAAFVVAASLTSAFATASADAATYSLAVSSQANRSGAVALSGRSYVQPANVYVFSTPTTGATRVRFYLDDPARSQAPRTTEGSAPFDFAGTRSDGAANALNVGTLSAGAHTITAAVETTGATSVVSASFNVTTPPDTTKPSSPVLSATGGDHQVALAWTAATDNVAVTRYEVWQDGAWATGLPATARSYAVAGLAPGVSHSFRVVAYDGAANYANSNTVSAAANPTSPAAFPSRLRASGRTIVDENGYVLPMLRGFNMHVGPSFVWDQSHFDAIKALGGRIDRAVVHWDDFEPARGVVSAAAIANLDRHVASAQAAGIYTLLELHLNVGRTPSWTAAQATELERYATYGQTLTQYLANRYGNPASAKYTKAVIGFGLNEPPLQDSAIRNGNGSIPYLESRQRQMISWMRAPGFAPSWIGFVAYGYGSATPIYDHATQNASAVDASPTAYDQVGGNVVIDVHDYMAYCTNTNPACDGRQFNGMIHPTYQGGPMLATDGLTSAYTSSTIHRSQQAAFLKPYKTFSTQAAIPLMLGEWGWSAGHTGEAAWAADKRIAWMDAGTAIQIQWNYDTATSAWAARPDGVWRTSTLSVFGG